MPTRLWRFLMILAIPTTAIATTVPQNRELTPREQAVHVLNRLAFGPRPGDVTRVEAKGVDHWIERQLHPERIDDSALDRFIASSFRTISTDQDDLLAQYADAQRMRQIARRPQAATGDSGRAARPPRAGQPAPNQIRLNSNDSAALRQRAMLVRNVGAELMSAKVARAVASERQLQEVMTDFWMNHFNVYIRKGGPAPFFIGEYESGVRDRALGDFRELLGFVAKSPAMLFYLDNVQSVADSMRPTLGGSRRIAQRRQQERRRGLNENYARELLELHTLGVDGGYTQQDVIEVARALTGWTIRPPQLGGGFLFRPQVHDAGEKTVLGQRLAAGRGIEDGEDVLDIVAGHPSAARYIATKLARRFVSDSPSNALIDYAAGIFARTHGDITATLRAIVTSPEFFSRRTYRSKVKSPFEVVVSTARALGAAPDPTPRSALAVAYLGQPLYGHQAPNGYPETGVAWMNTGAILNRINFGLAIAAGRLPSATLAMWPDAARLQNSPREQQVSSVVAALLGGAVSPETRTILTTGEHPMIADGSVGRAAANAATQPVDDLADNNTEMSMPSRPRPRQTGGLGPDARGLRGGLFARAGQLLDLEGLAEVVGLALGSPEFQRR